MREIIQVIEIYERRRQEIDNPKDFQLPHIQKIKDFYATLPFFVDSNKQ